MTGALATRPRIRTARLDLRPLAPADAPRLADLADDFEVVKTTGGMPFPYTLADAEKMVARAAAADPAKEPMFAIDLAGEGPVGTLAFYPPGDQLGPEVGYWLGRAYWGQGIASEALGAAMDWARDDWGRRCITACHQLENESSGRVLVKAGFLYTGQVDARACKARGHDMPVRWMVWLA